jgi:hypothetical protein
MANRSIPKHYLRLVWAWAAEGIKTAAILDGLQRVAMARGWKDPLPSERTIRTIYKKAQGLDPDERREQTRFKWPQTMEKLGALPWSAARSALDLVRYRDERGEEPPTIREAKWFIRLRQAAPGLPDEYADRWASALAVDEFVAAVGLGKRLQTRALNLFLAYQPWRTEEDQGAWNKAAGRHGLPRWAGLFRLDADIGDSPRGYDEMYEYFAEQEQRAVTESSPLTSPLAGETKDSLEGRD